MGEWCANRHQSERGRINFNHHVLKLNQIIRVDLFKRRRRPLFDGSFLFLVTLWFLNGSGTTRT